MVNFNKWIYNGQWKSGKANGPGKYFAKDGSGNFLFQTSKKFTMEIGLMTKNPASEN
jgi:hypothetical protein